MFFFDDVTLPKISMLKKSYSNVRKQTLDRYTTSKYELCINFVLQLFAKEQIHKGEIYVKFNVCVVHLKTSRTSNIVDIISLYDVSTEALKAITMLHEIQSIFCLDLSFCINE